MDNNPIHALEREKLSQWVVQRVSGFVKLDNVIFEVSRRTGWNWEVAKQFVSEIQEDYKNEIELRRFPITALSGTAFFLVGFYIFYSAFDTAIPLVTNLLSGMEPNQALSFFLAARSAYFDMIRLFTGLAMMVGGGIGLIQAIQIIW